MLVKSDIIDPFIEDETIVVFREWLESKEKELGDYEDELRSYDGFPDFIYKTVNKFILDGMEFFKKKQITKPATSFYNCLSFLDADGIREKYKLIDIMYKVMAENVVFLELYKNGDAEDKGNAAIKLKERGFM